MRVVKLRPWIRRFKRWRARLSANASVIIAACSMVIALVAAGLSGYSAYLTREHDRLSVRPKLLFTFAYDGTGAGWKIVNMGLGPARIRGFRVLINGVEQKAADKEEFWTVIARGLNLPAETNYQFTNPRVDEMIPVEQTMTLCWVNKGPASQTLEAQYKNVGLEFCYCSIYDECWFGWSGIALSVRDDKCSAFSKEPLSNWWQG